MNKSVTSIPILEMKNITKRFPGVLALSDVSLEILPGEVHILMGENGAGKSTLMKVLSGAYVCEEGEIFFNQKKMEKWSPSISQKNGIAMVYQEFNLVPYRTVIDNMFLGRELKKGMIFLEKKKMEEEVIKLLDSFGINLDIHSSVANLGVAQQQMVEIAKALLFDAKILVLDEPTAALTLNETKQLFRAIARLKSKGVAIIYISHRLEEIKQIGDRVSVLRDGKYIGTNMVDDVEVEDIVRMMVGREVSMMYTRNYCKHETTALKVENLNNSKLQNICFELKYGEILGFSGLVGAGRTELARAIFGLDNLFSGDIYIDGKKVEKWNATKAIENGIGYVSEDRKDEGLFLNLGVHHNTTISSLHMMFKNGLINLGKEKKCTSEFVDKLKIKTPKVTAKVQNLSGGNQQKVVVGKWLNTEPKILIFDEPTRGIDIGAKVEIHSLMDKLVNQGNAVIMISSDLPEVMGMSDRIMVMADGTIKKEFLPTAEPEELISCAMGE